jgi:ABC-type Fe3+/spermidine/putrescine transport system ATPase subunit
MIHTTDYRAVGDRVSLSFNPDDIHVMRAEQRNILDATMPEDNTIEFLGAKFECLYEKSDDDTALKAVIKPADWIISKDTKNAKLTAKVTIVSYHSERYEFLAEANGIKIMLESPDAVKIGDIIALDVDKDDIDIMR